LPDADRVLEKIRIVGDTAGRWDRRYHRRCKAS
jgi:hypothetical protein